MSHVEDLELSYLASLRGALEPELADGVRIRRQLAAALAMPMPSVPSSSAAPNTDVLRKFFASRAAQLLGVALVSGTLGIIGGHRMGQHRHVSSFGPTAIAPAVLPDPVGVDPGREMVAAVNDLAIVAESDRPKRAMPTAPAVASNAPPTVDDPLIEEMQLLRRAERAIRANNGLLALAMLRELDQRFPKGQLLEEREAARVMANCELNPPEVSREMAEKYLGQYPRSVYAARIRSICLLSGSSSRGNVTESEASGD